MSQVIKKRRIVLASVLKPVDDTRMLEKIGGSLIKTNSYDITIIGYPSSGQSTGIQLLPLPAFRRLSIKRLFAPWIVYQKINEVKPDIIIINTPELLFIAALQRVLFRRKIVYDVLENYYRTIRFTPTYPPIIRDLLALSMRLKEILFAPFVSRFLFAEEGYKNEIEFAKAPLVLQNKLPRSIASTYTRRGTGYSKLVFSGTIAETSGIFEAISLCKGLHEVDHSYSLTIVGYCPIPSVLTTIKNEIKGSPFIKLIGGNQLVPHEQILMELSQSDFGIIIYPDNPSTRSSIPTKLFEYLAIQLPILIRHNDESNKIVEDCGGGIILKTTPDYKSLSLKLKTLIIEPAVSDSVYWDSEAENLINCLKMI